MKNITDPWVKIKNPRARLNALLNIKAHNEKFGIRNNSILERIKRLEKELGA